MTDAPENIWAWANMAEDGSGHDRGVWYTEDAGLDGDETQYIRADIHEALEAEMNHFRKSGIIEVAVRNPNVSDYMAHWEGRTARAEAENERLREALLDVGSSLVAAVSILERSAEGSMPAYKVVASDKMFRQMIVDYKKSIQACRTELEDKG